MLSRLIGTYPQLTPQEAVEIVFLTADKSPFISTGDLKIDEYLYGSHGTIDPIAAMRFAAEFVDLRTKEYTPQLFQQRYQTNKAFFQSARNLRQQLDLMALLEQHHDNEERDPDEKKVLNTRNNCAKKINKDELYKQSKGFFVPDDLQALTSLIAPQDNQMEAFIKENFAVSRDSTGCTPLHNSIEVGHINLVRYYVECSPHLINDDLNVADASPLLVAVAQDQLNVDIAN